MDPVWQLLLSIDKVFLKVDLMTIKWDCKSTYRQIYNTRRTKCQNLADVFALVLVISYAFWRNFDEFPPFM